MLSDVRARRIIRDIKLNCRPSRKLNLTLSTLCTYRQFSERERQTSKPIYLLRFLIITCSKLTSRHHYGGTGALINGSLPIPAERSSRSRVAGKYFRSGWEDFHLTWAEIDSYAKKRGRTCR